MPPWCLCSVQGGDTRVYLSSPFFEGASWRRQTGKLLTNSTANAVMVPGGGGGGADLRPPVGSVPLGCFSGLQFRPNLPRNTNCSEKSSPDVLALAHEEHLLLGFCHFGGQTGTRVFTFMFWYWGPYSFLIGYTFPARAGIWYVRLWEGGRGAYRSPVGFPPGSAELIRKYLFGSKRGNPSVLRSQRFVMLTWKKNVGKSCLLTSARAPF